MTLCPCCLRSLSGAALVLSIVFVLPAWSEDLKGHVEQSQGLTRLPRPATVEPPLNSALRIYPLSSGLPQASSLPLSPLSGQAGDSRTRGTLKAEDFWLPAQALTPQMAPRTALPGRRCCLGGGRPWTVSQAPWSGQFALEPFASGGFEGWTEIVPVSLRGRVFGARRNVEARIMISEPSGRLLAPESWKVPDGAISAGSWSGTPPSTALPAFNSYKSALAEPPERFVEQQIDWQKWYSQVAGALYERFAQGEKCEGQARLRLTVYSTRRLEGQIVDSAGASLKFKEKLAKTIESLNGTVILAFPARSKRGSVTFDADFQTGEKTEPGCSPVNVHDLEFVRQRQHPSL